MIASATTDLMIASEIGVVEAGFFLITYVDTITFSLYPSLVLFSNRKIDCGVPKKTLYSISVTPSLYNCPFSFMGVLGLSYTYICR